MYKKQSLKISRILTVMDKLDNIGYPVGEAAYTSREIASWVEMSHSTVYRTLQEMTKRGICNKELHMGSRGDVFRYSASPEQKYNWIYEKAMI